MLTIWKEPLLDLARDPLFSSISLFTKKGVPIRTRPFLLYHLVINVLDLDLYLNTAGEFEFHQSVNSLGC